MINKAANNHASRLFHYGAAVAIVVAGISHLAITPLHYAHIPAHGVFFAVAGIIEVVWAVMFWRSASPLLWRAGVAIAGGLFILWSITQYLGAPFSHESEPVDVSTIVCKASEILGIASLTALLFQGSISHPGQSREKFLAGALALAVIVGIGSFGVGRAVEPLFPHLGPIEEHQPQHEHGEENLLFS